MCFFFKFDLTENTSETIKDGTCVKEPAASFPERGSSFTKLLSPFKKELRKSRHCAASPALEKPESSDFATGIAETYFSTDYWKSNLSSEFVCPKQESEREKNEAPCCMKQKFLEDTVICTEEKKPVARNSLLQGDQETNNKSHTVLDRTSLSLADAPPDLCFDVCDFRSPAMQDRDVSNLINEVSLTNESDTSSSVSALIGQFDVTDDQTNLNVVSSSPGTTVKTVSVKTAYPPDRLPNDRHATFGHTVPSVTHTVSSSFSAPEIKTFSSPETTEYSLYTIIHETSLSPASDRESGSKLACKNSTEDPGALLSCISPANVLQSTPPRKCGTNWESLGNNNSCILESSDLEDTIVFPFTCLNSTGSSLMEVDGNLQDLLITAYEYKREEMSQLASPLKLKSNQDTPQHRANFAEDCKFRCDTTQHFPCPEHQGVNLLYNNYLQFSDTQNELLKSSRRANIDSFLVPKNALPFSSPTTQKQPSPCKSKSLGDLTSEDISCNFESKYKYISRGFITSGMRDKMMATLKAKRPQSTDSLTEQLRKLVSLDVEDGCQSMPPKQNDDCPKLLVRKLSSRSQSRVRNIASRAKERQEANKQKLCNASSNVTGVVFRNKPSMSPHVINRHSTGSYIASYLDNFSADDLEGRGVPEGACTSLRYGYNDRFSADDSLLETKPSEEDKPEIYFLLRL